MNDLSAIRELAQNAELETALETLRAWASTHARAELIFCDQQLANIQITQKPYLAGRITFDDHKRNMANVTHALLEKLDELEGQNQAQENGTNPGAPFHALSCDRVDQTDAFEQYRKQFATHKIQFYYLYGAEPQAHKSLFTRLALELEARNKRTVLQIDLNIKESRDPQIYKEKFVRDLYSKLGVNPDLHENLLNSDLQFLIEKSPKIKALGAQDAMFILAHVSHWTWDKDLTPAAARWFILDFCKCVLPAEAPAVLFFFSFDYNESDNPSVKTQVVGAVTKSDFVQALPELGMVLRRHVGAWLAEHPQFVPTSQERNLILNNQFAAPEYVMETVEEVLNQIIDNSKNRLTR
ncbi:MAG: hypothetical protein ACOYPR_10035 [Saprospiraceae bacterium]